MRRAPTEPAWRSATENATLIDGNAGARTTRQTPEGRSIALNPFDSTRNVTIGRERTVAAAGGGWQYVTCGQRVFTAGAGDDQVRVTRCDGQSVSLDINGERYRLELATGQQLTVRPVEGNDVVDFDVDVDVNIMVDGGSGNTSSLAATAMTASNAMLATIASTPVPAMTSATRPVPM